MIVLDTNAAIYYLQNDPRCVRVIEKLRQSTEQFALSAISEVELFSFPALTELQAIEISRWLQECTIIAVDSLIARQAARLRRTHRLKAPDAIIAATAVSYGGKLVTRDKQFLPINQLAIIPC